MNNKIQTIDLNGLKQDQIEQIQTIIDTFKQQNQLDASDNQDKEISQSDLIDDIFFESEILQPFNRIVLYGDRI